MEKKKYFSSWMTFISLIKCGYFWVDTEYLLLMSTAKWHQKATYLEAAAGRRQAELFTSISFLINIQQSPTL